MVRDCRLGVDEASESSIEFLDFLLDKATHDYIRM